MRNPLVMLACLCLGLSGAVLAQTEMAEPLPPPVMSDPEAMPPEPAPADPAAPAAAPLPTEWLRKPRPDTVICPFRGRIDYEDGEIECGLIQVPENREAAGSRSIELHYVRILAKGEDEDGDEVAKRTDPVIYLTGGPGVGVEYYVNKLKDHRIVEQRDLYILEQRGIGSSTSFCPFFDARNRASQIHDNFEDYQRNMFVNARTCIENARAGGIDMRGYNTFENARDVRALRMALGFERWNVWGISYGSVLAQAVVKIDPDGIQALAIDGIVPLDIADLMRVASWYDRDLTRLAAACAQQPSCAQAYPDQLARYLAAIRSVLDQPFALTVKPGEIYPDGRAYVFADYVAGIPFSLLYEQKTHPALPAIIEGLIRAVETRDQTRFKALAVSATEQFGEGDFGAGMSLAIRCQDGYVDRLAATIADEHAKHPELASALSGSPAVVAEMPAACAAGGLPTRDMAPYAPLQTDLPVLVANGAWDPVTPTPLAEYIMPGLSKGRLAEFPHAGHGATRSVKCGGVFLNKFFDDPAAPLDQDCIDNGEKAAHYVAPYFPTRAFALAAVEMAEDKKQLLPYGIWLGVSLLLILVGLLVAVFGWLGRRIDGEPRRAGTVARVLTGLAALSGTGYAAGLGVATALSAKMTPVLLLFGLVGWAAWVAWLGPVTGALGVLALLVAVFAGSVGRAGRIGCVLVALAAISLSLFGWVWDLWPRF